MIRYLLLFITMLIPALSQAQTKPEEKRIVISDTTASGTVPFDRAFSMQYTPITRRKVTSISLFELDRCGCRIPFRCCECKSRITRNCKKCEKEESTSAKDSAKVKEEITSTVKKDTEKVKRPCSKCSPEGKMSVEIGNFHQADSGKVEFNMPAMGPNRRFMLVVAAQSKPDGIDGVIQKLRESRIDSANARYEAIVNRTRFVTSNDDPCSNCAPEFELAVFDTFQVFYSTSISPLMDSIAAAEKQLAAIRAGALPIYPVYETFQPSALKDVLDFSQECIACTDTLWQQLWISSNREELAKTLVNLPRLNDPNVYAGFVDVNHLYTTSSVATVKPADRINNLKKSIELVGHAVEFINYYMLKRFGATTSPASHQNLVTSLTIVLTNLRSNYTALTAHQRSVANQEKTVSRFTRAKDGLLNRWYGFNQVLDAQQTSTFVYNFNTRAGYAIKSDFGFLAYFGRKNYGSLHGFAPFIGFHVNLRPMNTHIPFRLIKCKGIAGHLAFHSGVLVGSFKKEGEYDGLIGGTAIFTGLGWALGHGFRFHGGAVWFRQKDPNPLVNDMSVSAVPYLGAALDLRLDDIYKSFTSIFKP